MESLQEAKKKVLAGITKERLIEVSRELVRIPSETGNEKAVSLHLGKRLKEMGFEVQWAEGEKDRPNVVGVLRGSTGKPKLQFSGHLDTVGPGDLKKWTTDPYGGEVIGNKIYGRGVMDSKGGGTASVVVALEALIKAGVKLKGDISIVGTVDEEVGGRLGMHYLVQNKIIDPDICVYCVHSDMEIKSYFKGLTQYKLIVKGQTAHGSTPEEGVNAINGTLRILRELEKGLPFKKHPVLGNHTVNFGWIRGGERYNIVCDYCEAGIDMRLIPGQTWQKAVEYMEGVISNLKKKHPELDARIEVIQDHGPVEVKEDDLALKIVGEAAKEVRGEYPKIGGTIAAGDLAPIFKKGGIPAVGYGPGDLKRGNAHKENEFLEIDQLIDASKVYATIMLNVCY
jgi:succinyl-diaminopimelate desuccinylase